MALFLYRLGLFLYHLGMQVISPLSPKASQRLQGNKQWKKDLSGFEGKKTIWMHCASLGEFEQGRPLFDTLAKDFPNRDIVLSFYSPSGYNIRKNYKYASRVVYLPDDSLKNASEFLDCIKPELIIFVKYDFWYYYLHEAKKRNIKTILIAARFFQGQKYFSGIFKNFYLEIFSCFHFIFTQDKESLNYLKTFPELKAQVKIAGDPRFDRVLNQSRQLTPLPDIQDFISSSFCVIAGSTWPQDDALIIQTILALKNSRIRWIIAPHEYSEKNRLLYQKYFRNEMVLFSELSKLNPAHTLIMVDKVGYLSSLYSIADLAYIGGGQHKRIHNIQEPAVFGIPIGFGPKYTDFREAHDLIQLGGAEVIHTPAEMQKFILKYFQNPQLAKNIRSINYNYIESRSGASGQILGVLQAANYIG